MHPDESFRILGNGLLLNVAILCKKVTLGEKLSCIKLINVSLLVFVVFCANKMGLKK